jgi:hypothetical protein
MLLFRKQKRLHNGHLAHIKEITAFKIMVEKNHKKCCLENKMFLGFHNKIYLNYILDHYDRVIKIWSSL